jgi:hypothetical protein
MRCYFLNLSFASILLSATISYGAYLDLNFLSFSDTLKTSSTTGISRSSYDVGIGVLMGKAENWIWALNIGGGNFADKAAATDVTFKFTDLGMKVGYFWNKQKSWFCTLSYNIESKAKYNDGSGEVELRGTSIKADLGYAYWPVETVGLAMKVLYYAPTFKESIAANAITNVSYSRTLLYPSIGLIISF